MTRTINQHSTQENTKQEIIVSLQ